MRTKEAQTTVYRPPPTTRHHIWYLGAVALGLLIFVTGIVAGRFALPRQSPQEKIVEVPVRATVYERDASWQPQRNVDEEVNQKLAAVLQNCSGVLEIKDNEAQTVRYKKAAIGKKGGFGNLKKGVPHTIHGYFVYQKTGRGLASDSEGNLFFIDWQTGMTNPPAQNPGSFTVVSGRRIEVGLPK